MTTKCNHVYRYILPLALAAIMVLLSMPVTVRAEEATAVPADETVAVQSEEGQTDEAAEDADIVIAGSEGSPEGYLPAEEPSEEPIGGTCGEDLNWLLEEGALTISSEKTEAVMSDFTIVSPAPWNEYREDITTVKINTAGALTLGAYAFKDCSNLAEIENADKILKLNGYAFAGCASLVSLDGFAGLTDIGAYAFQGSGLQDVTLPEGVKTLKTYAFSGCDKLEHINVNQAAEIGNYAFRDCKNLESIDLNHQVKGIFPFAFSGCSKLRDVENMDAVNSIARYAFYGCTGLTEFKLPSTVQELNEFTFGSCTGLTKVFIPKEIYITSKNPFEGCSDSMILFTEAEGSAYEDIDWITNRHVSSTVSEAQYDLCRPNTDISSVDLTVFEDVPEYAFYGCTALKELTVSDAVSSIGKYAFYGCSALGQLKIPSGIGELQDNTFGQCTGLTKVYIPKTIAISETESPDDPFAGCSDHLVLFTETAYTGSTWLAARKVSADISEETYTLCSPNEEVLSLDLSVFTDVPNYAFYGAFGLEEISIPASVKSIGQYAFNSCPDLKKAVFRTDACSIHEKAFGNNAEGFTVYGISGTDYYRYCVSEKIPFEQNEICLVHTADMLRKEEAKEATCTEPGYEEYWVCTICGEYFADENAETHLSSRPLISRIAHTNGDPVRENEIPATCISEGSYDEVTYCSVCGAELSRESKNDEMIPHTPAAPVKENEIPAALQTKGQYEAVTYCSYCGLELGRETVIGKYLSTIQLANKSVSYNKKAQTVDVAVVAGSTGKVTYTYYADKKCTSKLAASKVKPVGTYYVKASVAADAEHLAATSNVARLTIKQAASTLTLSDKTANYTRKAISIGRAKVAGSTGNITYTYYTNKACTKKTTKANSGASGSGKAPAYIGTYYVKAAVAADSNYKAASKKVSLVIRPKVSVKYVSLFEKHPEYRNSGYTDRYYLYPSIKMTGVKYYRVELYNSKNKRINKDYKTKYTALMNFGTKPSNANFKKGEKYKLKLIIVPAKGRQVTVTSKWLTFNK